ncbi:MAG: hypothetical protein ACLQQ4_08640 [Bacteroidia bacterium]
MKKLSLVLAAMILFAGISFAQDKGAAKEKKTATKEKKVAKKEKKVAKDEKKAK